MSYKSRPAVQSIAFLLIFIFTFSEVSHAAAMNASAGSAAFSTAQERLLRNPLLFQAPLQFSRLRGIHEGTQDTLVIHIQDAHSNFSGQDNLSKTLDEVMSKYGISVVLVEGGSGDVTLTPVKKIASPAVWKQVGRKFLIEGKISGEEYLNLTSDHSMKIIGVEDDGLYQKSLHSYADLADSREKTLDYLRLVQRSLEKIKNRFYSDELLAYEKNRTADEAGSLNTEALFVLVQKHSIDLAGFPNTQKLLELKAKEALIDFNLANLEQASLLQEVHRRGGGETLDDELKKWKGSQSSQTTLFAFFQNSFNIAKEKNISLEPYPNLLRYAEYLKSFSGLDLDSVLTETQKLEDKVYHAILTDHSVPRGPGPPGTGGRVREALLVRAIDRYLKLLVTAYSIQMSTDDFSFFKANEPDFATEAYMAWINRKLVELGYIEDVVPANEFLEEGKKSLEAFYESVSSRDESFIQNTTRALAEEKQKIAVLITGGYHTPNLKQLFQKEGWSYAVVTPIVTSPTNQKKYEDVLLEKIRENKTIVTAGSENLLKAQKKTEGIRAEATAQAAARLAELVTDAAKLAGTEDRIPKVLADTFSRIADSTPLRVKDGARLAGENRRNAKLFEAIVRRYPQLEDYIREMEIPIEGGWQAIASMTGANSRIYLKPDSPIYYKKARSKAFGGVGTILNDDRNSMILQEAYALSALIELGREGLVPELQVIGVADDGSSLFLGLNGFTNATSLDKTLWISLNPLEKIDVLIQLAERIKRVHEKKWVHNDIMPANILIETPHEGGEEIRTMLIDFGLSLFLGKNGSVWSRATNHYSRPPEDLRTYASDVYNFGRLLEDYLDFSQSVMTTGELNGLAISMLQINPNKRPSIDKVIRRLKLSRESIQALSTDILDHFTWVKNLEVESADAVTAAVYQYPKEDRIKLLVIQNNSDEESGGVVQIPLIDISAYFPFGIFNFQWGKETPKNFKMMDAETRKNDEFQWGKNVWAQNGAINIHFKLKPRQRHIWVLSSAAFVDGARLAQQDDEINQELSRWVEHYIALVENKELGADPDYHQLVSDLNDFTNRVVMGAGNGEWLLNIPEQVTRFYYDPHNFGLDIIKATALEALEAMTLCLIILSHQNGYLEDSYLNHFQKAIDAYNARNVRTQFSLFTLDQDSLFALSLKRLILPPEAFLRLSLGLRNIFGSFDQLSVAKRMRVIRIISLYHLVHAFHMGAAAKDASDDMNIIYEHMVFLMGEYRHLKEIKTNEIHAWELEYTLRVIEKSLLRNWIFIVPFFSSGFRKWMVAQYGEPGDKYRLYSIVARLNRLLISIIFPLIVGLDSEQEPIYTKYQDWIERNLDEMEIIRQKYYPGLLGVDEATLKWAFLSSPMAELLKMDGRDLGHVGLRVYLYRNRNRDYEAFIRDSFPKLKSPKISAFNHFFDEGPYTAEDLFQRPMKDSSQTTHYLEMEKNIRLAVYMWAMNYLKPSGSNAAARLAERSASGGMPRAKIPNNVAARGARLALYLNENNLRSMLGSPRNLKISKTGYGMQAQFTANFKYSAGYSWWDASGEVERLGLAVIKKYPFYRFDQRSFKGPIDTSINSPSGAEYKTTIHSLRFYRTGARLTEATSPDVSTHTHLTANANKSLDPDLLEREMLLKLSHSDSEERKKATRAIMESWEFPAQKLIDNILSPVIYSADEARQFHSPDSRPYGDFEARRNARAASLYILGEMLFPEKSEVTFKYDPQLKERTSSALHDHIRKEKADSQHLVVSWDDVEKIYRDLITNKEDPQHIFGPLGLENPSLTFIQWMALVVSYGQFQGDLGSGENHDKFIKTTYANAAITTRILPALNDETINKQVFEPSYIEEGARLAEQGASEGFESEFAGWILRVTDEGNQPKTHVKLSRLHQLTPSKAVQEILLERVKTNDHEDAGHYGLYWVTADEIRKAFESAGPGKRAFLKLRVPVKINEKTPALTYVYKRRHVLLDDRLRSLVNGELKPVLDSELRFSDSPTRISVGNYALIQNSRSPDEPYLLAIDMNEVISQLKVKRRPGYILKFLGGGASLSPKAKNELRRNFGVARKASKRKPYFSNARSSDFRIHFFPMARFPKLLKWMGKQLESGGIENNTLRELREELGVGEHNLLTPKETGLFFPSAGMGARLADSAGVPEEKGAIPTLLSSEIVIEKAKIKDVSRLSTLKRHFLARLNEKNQPLRRDLEIDFRETISGEQYIPSQIFVARLDGKIVGYAEAAVEGFEGNQYGNVTVMVVDPKYKDRGFGKQLFGAALEWLKKREEIASVVIQDVSGGATGHIASRYFGFKKLDLDDSYFLELTDSREQGVRLAASNISSEMLAGWIQGWTELIQDNTQRDTNYTRFINGINESFSGSDYEDAPEQIMFSVIFKSGGEENVFGRDEEPANALEGLEAIAMAAITKSMVLPLSEEDLVQIEKAIDIYNNKRSDGSLALDLESLFALVLKRPLTSDVELGIDPHSREYSEESNKLFYDLSNQLRNLFGKNVLEAHPSQPILFKRRLQLLKIISLYHFMHGVHLNSQSKDSSHDLRIMFANMVFLKEQFDSLGRIDGVVPRVLQADIEEMKEAIQLSLFRVWLVTVPFFDVKAEYSRFGFHKPKIKWLSDSLTESYRKFFKENRPWIQTTAGLFRTTTDKDLAFAGLRITFYRNRKFGFEEHVKGLARPGEILTAWDLFLRHQLQFGTRFSRTSARNTINYNRARGIRYFDLFESSLNRLDSQAAARLATAFPTLNQARAIWKSNLETSAEGRRVIQIFEEAIKLIGSPVAARLAADDEVWSAKQDLWIKGNSVDNLQKWIDRTPDPELKKKRAEAYFLKLSGARLSMEDRLESSGVSFDDVWSKIKQYPDALARESDFRKAHQDFEATFLTELQSEFAIKISDAEKRRRYAVGSIYNNFLAYYDFSFSETDFSSRLDFKRRPSFSRGVAMIYSKAHSYAEKLGVLEELAAISHRYDQSGASPGVSYDEIIRYDQLIRPVIYLLQVMDGYEIRDLAGARLGKDQDLARTPVFRFEFKKTEPGNLKAVYKDFERLIKSQKSLKLPKKARFEWHFTNQFMWLKGSQKYAIQRYMDDVYRIHAQTEVDPSVYVSFFIDFRNPGETGIKLEYAKVGPQTERFIKSVKTKVTANPIRAVEFLKDGSMVVEMDPKAMKIFSGADAKEVFQKDQGFFLQQREDTVSFGDAVSFKAAPSTASAARSIDKPVGEDDPVEPHGTGSPGARLAETIPIDNPENPLKPLAVPGRLILLYHGVDEQAPSESVAFLATALDNEISGPEIGANRPLVLWIESAAPPQLGYSVNDANRFYDQLSRQLHLTYEEVLQAVAVPEMARPEVAALVDRVLRREYKKATEEFQKTDFLNAPTSHNLLKTQLERAKKEQRTRPVVVRAEEPPYEAWITVLRAMFYREQALLKLSQGQTDQARFLMLYSAAYFWNSHTRRNEKFAADIRAFNSVTSEALNIVQIGGAHAPLGDILTASGFETKKIVQRDLAEWDPFNYYMINYKPSLARLRTFSSYVATPVESEFMSKSLIDSLVGEHADRQSTKISYARSEEIWKAINQLSNDELQDWEKNIVGRGIDRAQLAKKTWEWFMKKMDARRAAEDLKQSILRSNQIERMAAAFSDHIGPEHLEKFKAKLRAIIKEFEKKAERLDYNDAKLRELLTRADISEDTIQSFFSKISLEAKKRDDIFQFIRNIQNEVSNDHSIDNLGARLASVSAYGLKTGTLSPVPDSMKKALIAYFIENRLSANDAETVSNTLIRMTPQTLPYLRSWGVLTEDEVIILSQKNERALYEYLERDKSLALRIAALVSSYEQRYPKQKKILLTRLMPLKQFDQLLAKSIPPFYIFWMLKGRFSAVIDIDNTVKIVAQIKDKVGGESNAWTILIRQGHEKATDWVSKTEAIITQIKDKVGGERNAWKIIIAQGHERATDWVSKAEVIITQIKDKVGGERNAWKIIIGQGHEKAIDWVSKAEVVVIQIKDKVGGESNAWTIIIDQGHEKATDWVSKAEPIVTQIKDKVGGERNAWAILIRQGHEKSEQWVLDHEAEIESNIRNGHPLASAWRDLIAFKSSSDTLAESFGAPSGARLSSVEAISQSEAHLSNFRALAAGMKKNMGSAEIDFEIRNGNRFEGARIVFTNTDKGVDAGFFDREKKSGKWVKSGEVSLSREDVAQGQVILKRRQASIKQRALTDQLYKSHALQIIKEESESERLVARFEKNTFVDSAKAVVYLLDPDDLSSNDLIQIQSMREARDDAGSVYKNIYFVFLAREGSVPQTPISDDLSKIPNPQGMKLIYYGDSLQEPSPVIRSLATEIADEYGLNDKRLGFAPFEARQNEGTDRMNHFRLLGIVLGHAMVQRIDFNQNIDAEILKNELWAIFNQFMNPALLDTHLNAENLKRLQEYSQAHRLIYALFAARPMKVDWKVLDQYEKIKRQAEMAA